MQDQKLKLSHLQMLITVADCGSFSEAANMLQLSQSAVSYAIAALEEELGVTLLSRGRYGAQPHAGGGANCAAIAAGDGTAERHRQAGQSI
ncbi:MAG: LysR family transcriptional regulator [Cyanobacteria bacterium P01_A01_bin.135]